MSFRLPYFRITARWRRWYGIYCFCWWAERCMLIASIVTCAPKLLSLFSSRRTEHRKWSPILSRPIAAEHFTEGRFVKRIILNKPAIWFSALMARCCDEYGNMFSLSRRYVEYHGHHFYRCVLPSNASSVIMSSINSVLKRAMPGTILRLSFMPMPNSLW